MLREYVMHLLTMVWRLFRPVSSRVNPVKASLPLDWLGADEEWGDMCKAMKTPLIDLTKSVSMVVLALHAQRHRNAERTLRERVITDELGSWDPGAVDWSEPALYRETSLDALRSGMFRDVVRDDPELVEHAMDLVLAAS